MEKRKNIDPRTRIIEVAERLFYTEGIRATGTEKIMAESGVAKATFYRHFKSKDMLVLAYLDKRDQVFWDYLDNPAPAKDIDEALIRIDRLVNLPEITGCPFLLVAAEYPELTHPIHRRVIEHEDRIVEYFTDLLKLLAIDRAATATQLLVVLDGSLSMRRVYGASKQVPFLSAAQAILKSAIRSSSN